MTDKPSLDAVYLRAIAACQKERAEAAFALSAYPNQIAELERYIAKIKEDERALRAAVERVRDELRRDAVDSDLTGMWAWAVKERAHADALDAALRGGA